MVWLIASHTGTRLVASIAGTSIESAVANARTTSPGVDLDALAAGWAARSDDPSAEEKEKARAFANHYSIMDCFIAIAIISSAVPTRRPRMAR